MFVTKTCAVSFAVFALICGVFASISVKRFLKAEFPRNVLILSVGGKATCRSISNSEC